MNGKVPTWKINFVDPVLVKYLEKTYPLWKNQIRDMYEVTVFHYQESL